MAAHTLSPNKSIEMARHPWRISLLGAVIPLLLAALTLSWVGTMMGVFVGNDPHSSALIKKKIEEAMILPDNFHNERKPKTKTPNIEDNSQTKNSKLDDKLTTAALPPVIQINGDQVRQNNFHPRVISLYEPPKNKGDQAKVGKNAEQREIKMSKRAAKEQKRLLKSDDFSYRDPLYEGDCVPMQPWQETSFPNCNTIHELDFYGKSRTNEFSYFTSGGYNDIFRINEYDKEDDPELVMKILEFGTEYSDRNFDRVRRDGLILERLTKSSHVLNTYGFCGFDVLAPYANGGTLSNIIREWRKGRLQLSPLDRLKYAVEVAQGLADVHDIDGEGLSSVAHGDLKGQQYLIMDGKLLLGDFNRGRFLRRNSTDPTTACPYTIGKNDAAFRSPEEYLYVPQTSAVDVWALGSIFYLILTGKEPWSSYNTEEAQERIAKGELPNFDGKLLENGDPVNKILKKSIDMCYVYDPKKRATANEVSAYLENALHNYEKSLQIKMKRRSISKQ